MCLVQAIAQQVCVDKWLWHPAGRLGKNTHLHTPTAQIMECAWTSQAPRAAPWVQRPGKPMVVQSTKTAPE